MMESVEDIPADAILDGLAWDWETYGEYLARDRRAAEGRQRRRDGRALRGAPLRDGRAQPRRGRRRPTTTSRRCATSSTRRWARARSASRRRARCCTASPTAGRCPAPGPTSASCSRSPTCSAGTARACTRSRRASNVRATNYEGTRAEVHWMAEINRRTGRPVTFGLAQSNAGPELFRKILELVDEEAAAGGELRPQTTARGIGLLFGMQHRTFFDRAPAWARAAAAPARRPARRARRRRAARRAASRPPTTQHAAARLARRVRAHRRRGRLLGRPRRRRWPPTPSAAGESIAEAFVASRSRPTGGPCSTTRSSTSGWTRSRRCSTTRAWRSASATRARTSA